MGCSRADCFAESTEAARGAELPAKPVRERNLALPFQKVHKEAVKPSGYFTGDEVKRYANYTIKIS
jgi:hypothetical protein